jgi:hypothetical protein
VRGDRRARERLPLGRLRLARRHQGRSLQSALRDLSSCQVRFMRNLVVHEDQERPAGRLRFRHLSLCPGDAADGKDVATGRRPLRPSWRRQARIR